MTSVKDSSDGSSSGPVAAGRHTGSDNVLIPVRLHVSFTTFDETGIVRAPVWMPSAHCDETLPTTIKPSKLNLLPPIRDSSDRSSSGTVSVPSYIQCVYLLGVELHPDSIKLVCDLFCDVCASFMRSLAKSIGNYISIALSSGLSKVGRAIWFKTYRELHLYSFVSRCFCVYHSRYRPTFIRAIAEHVVVPSSGCNLVDFLSRLDRVVRDLAETIFSSKWDMEAAKACSGLEDESLSDVIREDFIRVLNIVDVPMAALSISYKYIRGRRCCKVSGTEITSKGTALGGGSTSDESSSSITDDSDYYCGFGVLADESSSELLSPPSISFAPISPSTSGSCSQSEKRLGPLLLLKGDSNPSRFVRLFSCIDPVAVSNVSECSSSNVGVDVLVSTVEDVVSDFAVSGDESSSSDSGSSSELGSSSSKLPVASSVSTSAIEEPSTAASSSYFRVPPKKLFIMQGLFSGSRTLEVPIGSDAAA
ncbi:hypothetical protein, partial [Candidatus Ichthyocystis sparus]|uniref:hypothetical protein n=1 Tax=Candidatus Ichthyocystis sparus TaxID=1561004 RepID=UPI001146E1C2